MNMKKVMAGAFAAASLAAVATPAQAAIVINAGTTVTVSGDTSNELDFSLGLSEGALSNPFQAFLNFSNDLAGYYKFAVLTTNDDVNFTSILLTGTGIGAPVELVGLIEDPETWAKNLNLAAGTFQLEINGEYLGTSTGSLGGNLNFAAVPEPATWLMMILGFGLVGGVMRRKQEQRVRYDFA